MQFPVIQQIFLLQMTFFFLLAFNMFGEPNSKEEIILIQLNHETPSKHGYIWKEIVFSIDYYQNKKGTFKCMSVLNVGIFLRHHSLNRFLLSIALLLEAISMLSQKIKVNCSLHTVLIILSR